MFAHGAQQIEAAHARHAHVADHRVVAPGSQVLEGLPAATTSEHLIAPVFQHAAQRVAHGVIVVDEQHLGLGMQFS